MSKRWLRRVFRSVDRVAGRAVGLGEAVVRGRRAPIAEAVELGLDVISEGGEVVDASVDLLMGREPPPWPPSPEREEAP